jgi:hypothetical protein
MMRGDGRLFKRKASCLWWGSLYVRGREVRFSTGVEHLDGTGASEKEKATAERKVLKVLKQKADERGADRIGARPFVGVGQERVAIDELCDALAENYKSRGKDSKQFVSNLSVVRERFGAMRAVNLTAADVAQWINELRAEGYAPATCNRYSQLLSQSFNLAIRNRVLASRPNIERALRKRQRSEGIREPRGTLLGSWRRGEILSLMWDDVDGDTVRLRAEHSKEREARSLALEGELADLIARRQSRRQGPLVSTAAATPSPTCVRHGPRRAAWRASLVGCFTISGARGSET